MKINSNRWNKLRYTFYTPIYDSIVRYFEKSRRRSIESLNIKKGESVLIIGAGTGLDLKYLPKDCEIIATDITPSMVERTKRRSKKLNLPVHAVVMDGQALEFPDSSFDKIILHLILAVIPDPVACLKESERVLKFGGQIAVFDKFVPRNRKVSIVRKFTNILTNFLATDITRDFESIIKETGLTVITDNDADFKGNFRLIRITKN